jgi:hypothetical protein
LDSKFLAELRGSKDIRFMGRHLRHVADLDRLDPRRMSILSEVMQLWIAVSAAASSSGGPDRGGDVKVMTLAQRGGAATRDAMKNGGADPVNSCAEIIEAFCATR